MTTDEILNGTIAAGDLATNIAISTTGTIATTGGSAITSSGLLTASAGATVTGVATVDQASNAIAVDVNKTGTGAGNAVDIANDGTGVGLNVSSSEATNGSAGITASQADDTANGIQVTMGHATAAGAGVLVDLTNAGATGNPFESKKNGSTTFYVDAAGAVHSSNVAALQALDLAEVFPTTGGILEPGDVVVIDVFTPETLTIARDPNDTKVAGIVSTKPGFTLGGENRGRLDHYEIALAGRVPTKACDENGPIQIGDLLVTSSTPGHVMKAPENPKVGTILGKALGSLLSGTGKIVVLVTLQ